MEPCIFFFYFWHTFQWHFLYFLKKKCFISSSKGKNGLYWSLKHSFPCFCFLRLFKTTRNERWSRSARNISTAFWNIFTCPHGLCVCVVQLLSNLFKWWWFLVFQWYLMTDVSFAIIFPWHAFCELLFNVSFKRFDIVLYRFSRQHKYDASRPQQGVQGNLRLHINVFVWDVCIHNFHRRPDKNISLFHAHKRFPVTASTSWPDLLMLADGTTTAFLQTDHCKLCSQIWLPPQSLHCDLLLLCSQIWLSPQSLHCDLFLPCLHLVCCFDFLQTTKHFMQHFVNWAVRLLILKHSNDKGWLHFVHCFFSIFINHQAHEKRSFGH